MKEYAGRCRPGPRASENYIAAAEWQRFRPKFEAWAREFWPEYIQAKRLAEELQAAVRRE